MGSADGNAVPEPHELGEHLRPRHDGNVPFTGARELRVVLGDGGCDDHHLATFHVLGIVADIDAHTEILQALGHGVGLQIGP